VKSTPPTEVPLPCEPEYETALIGMLDGTWPDVLDTEGAGSVSPEHFYSGDWKRETWRVALALTARGEAVNHLSLDRELRARDLLGDGKLIATVSDITECANHVPPNETPASCARVLLQVARRRADIASASRLMSAAVYETGGDAYAGIRARELAALTAECVPQAAPFHLMSIADILNQPRPPSLIEHFYTRNSTGIKFSPPGVGKTALLLDQMAHVALGRAWEGHAVHGGHVVYVCAEGQAFLPERLEALMRKLEVEDIPRLHILPVRIQLLEPRTVPGLLATFTKDLPEQPVWVAFDTVSQTAGGADENDANDMRDYVNALDRIREATGAFVDAIHHTGKDGSRGARGSSALHGNLDTVIQITDTDGVAVMKCEKQRSGWAPFKPFSYKIKSLALDDDAMRTGPVIEACEPPIKASMPATYVKTLDALAGCPGSTAAYATWLAAASAPASTFNRHRQYLLEYEYVHRDPVSDIYRLTTKGAALLPRYSHGTYTVLPWELQGEYYGVNPLDRTTEQSDLSRDQAVD
jgi:AAA domain-containing protein